MTYQAKYLQQDDSKNIRMLASRAAESGAVTVKVYGSEGFVGKVACTPDALLSEIDGMDIEVTLRFFDAAGNKLGWVFLVLGNCDDTTICDYGVNSWTEKVCRF